jgi:hypothetical protein
MLRRFSKWFSFRRMFALAPLAARMEPVGEWTNDDAEILLIFMKTPAGAKFRALLWSECADRAFLTKDMPVFERGVTAGMCHVTDMIERMAEKTEKAGEEE